MYKELSKISLIIIITGLTSCKKERLNGEYEVLVGIWKWEYSLHWHDNCDISPVILDTLYQSTNSDLFEIEFLKKGVINYSKNGIITNSHKIKFGTTSTGSLGVPESLITILQLDGDETNSRVCTWDGTNLGLSEFPFESDSCDTYSHYFLPG